MKYILGVFGVILVAIVAIILVTRGRTVEEQEGKQQLNVSQEAKPDTAAVFTTQGKLVGQTERRAIRIKITQDERRVEILTGYEEAVDRAHTYPNTPAAYEAFLVALNDAGFTRERETLMKDERGACPLGKRYVFEFKEYSQQLMRLWDTSCGKGQGGTFGGKDTTIRNLFEAQIPEYRKLVRNVDLN